jgi:hypothetical protein
MDYAATGKAIPAYRKAFGISPETPDDKISSLSSDLLSNDLIRARILQLQSNLAPASVFTKEQVLEELSKIIRTAIFPQDRIRALDLLGKYYKLFTDKEPTSKTYVGEQKIQIVYMSPDHKRITSISPLRRFITSPEITVAEPKPTPTKPIPTMDNPSPDTDLEKTLDSLCG